MHIRFHLGKGLPPHLSLRCRVPAQEHQALQGAEGR